eukprot:7039190-Lingulodinium_polyedra.AAC.1
MVLVGFELDGPGLRLRQTGARFWGLYLALTELCSWTVVHGDVLRRAVGHMVNFAMLARPALSVLGAVYPFIQRALGRVERLDGATRLELQTFRDLMIRMDHDLNRTVSKWV